MPKTIPPEQIQMIRKNSGKKSIRELAFKMGLSIATVKRYYLEEKKEEVVEVKKPVFKDDWVYPDDDDEEEERERIARPAAEYTQSPSPYGIANQLMGIKLTKRCYFDPK